MYEKFFGLREPAFSLTPDPRFLWPSKTHEEGLSALYNGVVGRKGFLLLTGGVGTGKTTLLRAVLAKIPADTETALVMNTADLSGKGLFKRMLPILESVYAPPATGLLVTNGLSPTGNRIGHNDVILEYDGHAIRNRADLTRADANSKIGQIVSVKIVRGGVQRVLRITVTDTAPGHLHFDSRPIVKR